MEIWKYRIITYQCYRRRKIKCRTTKRYLNYSVTLTWVNPLKKRKQQTGQENKRTTIIFVFILRQYEKIFYIFIQRIPSYFFTRILKQNNVITQGDFKTSLRNIFHAGTNLFHLSKQNNDKVQKAFFYSIFFSCFHVCFIVEKKMILVFFSPHVMKTCITCICHVTKKKKEMPKKKKKVR